MKPLQTVEQSILDGNGGITYHVFRDLKLVIAYFWIASSITIAGNYWYNYAIPSAVGVPAAHRDAPMVGGAGGNVGGMLRVNQSDSKFYFYSGNVGAHRPERSFFQSNKRGNYTC